MDGTQQYVWSPALSQETAAFLCALSVVTLQTVLTPEANASSFGLELRDEFRSGRLDAISSARTPASMGTRIRRAWIRCADLSRLRSADVGGRLSTISRRGSTLRVDRRESA